MAPFDTLASWPVRHVAAMVTTADGVHHHHGDIDSPFPLASITKLLTAMAALVAHEEGTLPIDEPVTEEGATTADLLAHCAGIAPDEQSQMTLVRTRRIYSSAAYDMVAELIAERSGMPFPDYLHEAVAVPLDLQATTLPGSAGAGARSSVRDLSALAAAWQTPMLVDEATLRRATQAHEPALTGVLPGFGRQDPNPWGLGPEIRGEKSPHWTAAANSPDTFGHFGQSGTMMWIDPQAGVTTIALTDQPFGEWATTAWPRFSDDALLA